MTMPKSAIRNPQSAIVVFAIFAAAVALSGCSGPSAETIETRVAMDAEVTVHAIAPTKEDADRCVAAAWQEMELCLHRLDPRQPTSDIGRINSEAGRFTITVDPLTTSCLAAARETWIYTDHLYDPTVGPLTALWKEAERQNRLPTDAEIAAARSLLGMDKVEILVTTVQKAPDELGFVPPGYGPPRPEEMTKPVHAVGIRKGMRLDLGGVVKGYIAGRMAARMKMAGATAGLVAAAGDIYAFGELPARAVQYALGAPPRDIRRPGDDRQWTVAVQDPRDPDGRTPYTSIHIENQAVDTGSRHARGFTIQEKRYSDILDPRTGRPVENRIASVTVVGEDPALTDALATAIVVLGAKDGLALAETTHGVECLILEVAPDEPVAAGPDGAPPRTAKLIAHRTAGFADMEFKPQGQEPPAAEPPPAEAQAELPASPPAPTAPTP